MIIAIRITFCCFCYFTILLLTSKPVENSHVNEHYKTQYGEQVIIVRPRNDVMNIHALLDRIKRDRTLRKRKRDRDKERLLLYNKRDNIYKSNNDDDHDNEGDYNNDVFHNRKTEKKEFIPKGKRHDSLKKDIVLKDEREKLPRGKEHDPKTTIYIHPDVHGSKKTRIIHSFKNISEIATDSTDKTEQKTKFKKDKTSIKKNSERFKATGSKRELKLSSTPYEDNTDINNGEEYDANLPTLLKQFRSPWHGNTDNPANKKDNINYRSTTKTTVSTNNENDKPVEYINDDRKHRRSNKRSHRNKLHTDSTKVKDHRPDERDTLSTRELNLGETTTPTDNEEDNSSTEALDVTSAEVKNQANNNELPAESLDASERPKLEMHHNEDKLSSLDLDNIEGQDTEENDINKAHHITKDTVQNANDATTDPAKNAKVTEDVTDTKSISQEAMKGEKPETQSAEIKPNQQETVQVSNPQADIKTQDAKVAIQNNVQDKQRPVRDETISEMNRQAENNTAQKASVEDAKAVSQDLIQGAKSSVQGIIQNARSATQNTFENANDTVLGVQGKVQDGRSVMENTAVDTKLLTQQTIQDTKLVLQNTSHQIQNANSTSKAAPTIQAIEPNKVEQKTKFSPKSFSDMIVEDVEKNKYGHRLMTRNTDLEAVAQQLNNPDALMKGIGLIPTSDVKTMHNPVTAQRILPFLGNRQTSKGFQTFFAKSTTPKSKKWSSLVKKTKLYNKLIKPYPFHNHHHLKYMYPLNYNGNYNNNYNNYNIKNYSKNNYNNVLKRSKFAGLPRSLVKKPAPVSSINYLPYQRTVNSNPAIQAMRMEKLMTRARGQPMTQAAKINPLALQAGYPVPSVIQNIQPINQESINSPIREYEHTPARLSAQPFVPPPKPNIYDKILKSVAGGKKKTPLDENRATTFLNSYYQHVKQITSNRDFWNEIAAGNYTNDDVGPSNKTKTKHNIPLIKGRGHNIASNRRNMKNLKNFSKYINLDKFYKQKKQPLLKCYKGHCQHVRQYADVKGSKKDILIGRLEPMLEMGDQDAFNEYASEINGERLFEEAGDDGDNGVNYNENDGDGYLEGKEELKRKAVIRKYSNGEIPKGINVQQRGSSSRALIELEDENAQGIPNDLRQLRPQADARISNMDRRYTPNRQVLTTAARNNEFPYQNSYETGEVSMIPMMPMARKNNAIGPAKNHGYMRLPPAPRTKLHQVKNIKPIQNIPNQYYMHHKPQPKEIVTDDKYNDIIRDFGRRRKYETDLLSHAAGFGPQPNMIENKLRHSDTSPQMIETSDDEHLLDAHLDSDKLAPIKDFTEFQRNKESEISLVQDIEEKDFKEYLQSLKKANDAEKKEEVRNEEASQGIPVNEYNQENDHDYRVSVARTAPRLKNYGKKVGDANGMSQLLQLNEYHNPRKKSNEYGVGVLPQLNEYSEENNNELGLAQASTIKDATNEKQLTAPNQKKEAEDYSISGLSPYNMFTHGKGLDEKAMDNAVISSLKGMDEKEPTEAFRAPAAREKAVKGVNEIETPENYEIMFAHDSPLREDRETERPVNRVTQVESMSSLKGEHEKEIPEFREASDRIPSVKENHENFQADNGGAFQYKFETELNKDENVGRRTVNGESSIPYASTDKDIANSNYEVKQFEDENADRKTLDTRDHTTYSTMQRYGSDMTPHTEQTNMRDDASERLMSMTENPRMLSSSSVYIKPAGIALNVKSTQLENNLEQYINDKSVDKIDVSDLIKGDFQDPADYGQKVSKLVDKEPKSAALQDPSDASLIDTPLGYKWSSNPYSGVDKALPIRKDTVGTNGGTLLGRNYMSFGKRTIDESSDLVSNNEVKNIIPAMVKSESAKEASKRAEVKDSNEKKERKSEVKKLSNITTLVKSTILSPSGDDKDTTETKKQNSDFLDLGSFRTEDYKELGNVDKPLAYLQNLKDVLADTKNKITSSQTFVVGSKKELLKKLTATKEDLLADRKPNKESIEDLASAVLHHKDANLLHNGHNELSSNSGEVTINNNNNSNSEMTIVEDEEMANNNQTTNTSSPIELDMGEDKKLIDIVDLSGKTAIDGKHIRNLSKEVELTGNSNTKGHNETDTKAGVAETKAGATDTKTGASETKPGAAETKPGAAERKIGAAETKAGAAETKTGTAETKPGTAERKIGATETKKGAADTKIGSAETKPGATKQNKMNKYSEDKKENSSHIKETKEKIFPVLNPEEKELKEITDTSKQDSDEQKVNEPNEKGIQKVHDDKNVKEMKEKDEHNIKAIGENDKDTMSSNAEKVKADDTNMEGSAEIYVRKGESDKDKIKSIAEKQTQKVESEEKKVKETTEKDVQKVQSEGVKENAEEDIQKVVPEEKNSHATTTNDAPDVERKKNKETQGQHAENVEPNVNQEEMKNNQPSEKEASPADFKVNNLKEYLEKISPEDKKLEPNIENTEPEGKNLKESDKNNAHETNSAKEEIKQGIKNETSKANPSGSKAALTLTKQAPISDSDEKMQKESTEKDGEAKEVHEEKTPKENTEKITSTPENEKKKNSENTMKAESTGDTDVKKIKESTGVNEEKHVSENKASSTPLQDNEVTEEADQLKTNMKEEAPKEDIQGNKLKEIDEKATQTTKENKTNGTSVEEKEMPTQNTDEKKEPVEKKLKGNKEKGALLQDEEIKKLKEATEKAGAMLDSKENKLKETMEKMASSDLSKLNNSLEKIDLPGERENKLKAAMSKSTNLLDPEEKKLKELLNKKVEEIMERFRKEKQTTQQWTDNTEQPNGKKSKEFDKESKKNDADDMKISNDIDINEVKETFKGNPAFTEREARKEFKEMADNNDEAGDKEDINHLKDDVDDSHNKTDVSTTKNIIESMPNPFADIGSIPDGPAYHANTKDTKGADINTELAEIIKSTTTNTDSNTDVFKAQHASERDSFPSTDDSSLTNLFLKRGYSDTQVDKKVKVL